MIRLKQHKHLTTALFFICCVFIFFSCTRKSDEITNKDETRAKATNVSALKSDFNESPQDLQDVDYKEFYDELSPHGKWVQVTGRDLGIDLKKQGTGAGNKPTGSLLYDLIGVNTAYATEDVDFGMFFVWQPSPDLYVGVAAGEPYVPYVDGRWIYSDYGWYYAAPTPVEEITHHYGRWAFTDGLGWVWLPGRVWAPAWVSWRDDDDFIAWSPLGPEACFVDYEFYDPVVTYIPERYVFVERSHFCDDEPYRWMHRDFDDPDHFRHLEKREGLVVVNNNIVNRGPDVRSIERVTGKHFEMAQVNRVNSINDITHSNSRINSFSPSFERSNTKGKMNREPVSSPKEFKQFSEVKSERQNSGASNDKNNGATRLNDNKSGNRNSQSNNINKKQTYRQRNKDGNQYSGVQKNHKNNTNSRNNYGNSKSYRGQDKQKQNKQYNGEQNRHGRDNNSGYTGPKNRQNDGQQKRGNDRGSRQNGNGNDRNRGNDNGSENKQHGRK
jgi:hypothetical protein